jgi:4a-hydroxytetrahydrobiopterin dehydratase
MGLLSDAEIERQLEGSQWRREGDTIVRDYSLADFVAAIELVDRVADEAEAANHHPDILVHGWNKVRLTLSTHSAGGLTDADFALATRIDEPLEPFSDG